MRPFIILVSLALAFGSAAAQTTAPVYKQRGGANADDISGSLRFPNESTLELKPGSTLVMQLAHVRAILDLLGADRGSIIYRGASGWTVLAPGTSGYALITGGTAADPYWGDVATDAELAAGLGGKADSVHTHALSTLTQSGASLNQVPMWNGLAWVPGTPASAFDIDGLTLGGAGDVDDSDLLVFSDGGVEKRITFTSMRDKLQAMAWTFDTLNVTTLNIATPVDLGSSTLTTQPPGDNSTKGATTAYVDLAVAGVSTSGINIVSSWPGSPTPGQWYYNTTATRLRYYPNGSDYHESGAYTFTDGTAPTLSSATIPAAGDSITLAFNEAVSIGAGGSAGWVPTLTGGASAMTYASGDGTSSLVYTLARTVEVGETGTLAYTQPGDGVEDGSGNDLSAIVSAAITNNSTIPGAPDYVEEVARITSSASTTATFTISSNVASGRTVAVLIRSVGNAVSSATDTAGNTYAIRESRVWSSTQHATILTAYVTSGLSAGNTIVVTFAGAVTTARTHGSVQVLSGCDVHANQPDVTIDAGAFSSSPSAGASTTAANTVLVGMICAVASVDLSAPSWTQIGTENTGDTISSWYFYSTAASSGAKTMSATLSGNDTWAALWVALK
jgi:hypothetical protein